MSSSGTYSPPAIGASGVLVATYAGVIITGVAAYAVTDRTWAFAYILSTIAAIAATVGLQWILSLVLSGRTTSYTYSYDSKTGIQRIVESSVGVIPGTKSTWDMPSATAQLTSFAASYWTAYISMQHRQDEKNGDPEVSHPFWHTGVLWLMTYMMVMVTITYGYNTIEQSSLGIIGGGALGYLTFKLSKNAV